MLIDGNAIAQEIKDEIKARIAAREGREPTLDVILVGDDPASHVYVKLKKKDCAAVGIRSRSHDLPSTISEWDLLQLIHSLNHDPECDGILVQLPLPSHIDELKVIHAIDPAKDVDGFHPVNMGKLVIGEADGLVPCTPLGVQVLLERSKIPTAGKHVVIVGRSNIVGKPLAALLLRRNGANATVTVAHSATEDLKAICLSADILVSAAGRPGLITPDMVPEGAIVIDVGTNRVADPSTKSGSRLVGDVDFNAVKGKCSAITPVPGGVGPMTRAMLLHNTLYSYEHRRDPCATS